ncbi:MAG: hypothetical protein JWO86_4351 [Myxococcaceae bacterium]|nr:hypothetical protein [Myxococcaceae bacterium]
MRWFRAAVVSVVVTSCLAACQLLAGVDDEEGVARPDGATPEAGPDVAPEAGDPCAKVRPPPPPSLGSVSDAGSLGPQLFAFRTFLVRPSGAPLGYDIDARCTGHPTSTTSEAPCIGAANGDTDDDDGGVDNSLGRVVEKSVPSDKDLAGNSLTSSVAKGNFTLLLEVFNYNGEPNDDAVSVAVITAPRLTANDCDGGLSEAGAPTWDGCETWATSGVELLNELPTTNLLSGYVADDVLVVTPRQKEQEIAFALGRTSLRLGEALATARIDRGGGSGPIRLKDGLLVGRVAADTLLAFFYRLEIGGTTALCEQGATGVSIEKTLRGTLCALRDVPLRAADDGKGSKCDALSFVLGFEAEPARMGDAGPAAELACPGDLDASCPP